MIYFAVILLLVAAVIQAYSLVAVRSLWRAVEAAAAENREHSKLWREHTSLILTQLSLLKLGQENADEDLRNFQSGHNGTGDGELPGR